MMLLSRSWVWTCHWSRRSLLNLQEEDATPGQTWLGSRHHRWRGRQRWST